MATGLLLLRLPRFAIAPAFPAMFQALFARSGALWVGLTFAFRTAHSPAQVKEKAVLHVVYVVLLEVVVGLLLPPESQLQFCIVNMPVLEMKSEKM